MRGWDVPSRMSLYIFKKMWLCGRHLFQKREEINTEKDCTNAGCGTDFFEHGRMKG